MEKIVKYNLLIFLFFHVVSAYGQVDSQKVIDEMMTKFRSYGSVEMSFSAVVTSTQDNSEMTQAGKIWLKGERYKLDLSPNSVLFFNGDKLYQYLPDVNEVNVTKPDPNSDDDFQLLQPQSFFRLTTKNFKSNFVKETTHLNRKVYEIDLYPVQIKSSKYSRIRLYIERGTLQIAYLKAFMKDGMQYALTLKPYVTSTTLPDSFFDFPTDKYQGVEVVDMTF